MILYVAGSGISLIHFYLKRSPTPKLGDRCPNVAGRVWVNSLGSFLDPAIDLNLWSRENEYFYCVLEKFMASCVTIRHLCLPDVYKLIVSQSF